MILSGDGDGQDASILAGAGVLREEVGTPRLFGRDTTNWQKH